MTAAAVKRIAACIAVTAVMVGCRPITVGPDRKHLCDTPIVHDDIGTPWCWTSQYPTTAP